ncbi:hypothetical protein [Saccharopolyspora elongata]|nr:hypothetical protein [Saccharopolyspora elongata]
MPGLQISVHGTADGSTIDALVTAIASQVGTELAVETRLTPL